MTAPRPEIQRYDRCHGQDDDGVFRTLTGKFDDGAFVLYSDHLRAVTLAKIEVLEEINPHTEQIYNKLVALRKELEG